ncbi:unnamed protein product [Schistosoma curassoni]|uniref:RT_RNaseH domain-containing protein n=1 Tax=Schistosoma curassoni TaxID=6186 RepID=A0A183KDS8_9TREM|nr:unnamed protein product [Schistosoma curassoni]
MMNYRTAIYPITCFDFDGKDVHSVLITDASPVVIGAVLEQEGRPVICVSRKLTVTKQGYSQTQREALAVFWSVKGLHKYLFGRKFTNVTDHEALKFIYHPEKSLTRSSAAMVQRRSIALSAYDYTVQHISAKQIQHVDYILRHSLQDRPEILGKAHMLVARENADICHQLKNHPSKWTHGHGLAENSC